MANKYLDQSGLNYFWGKVKDFFAPDTNPLAPGTANKGTSSKFARQDHVHPPQTSVSGNAGTATALATGREIDGITFDGSSSIVHFATCQTAANQAAKTATFPSPLPSPSELTIGLRVVVKFINANTASTPTLKVANLEAKSIFHKGAQIQSGGNKSLLAGVVEFVYDGSIWNLVGNYIDSTYTASSSVPLMDSGNGAVGTSSTYARGDHIHPSDTSKVDKENGKGLSTNDYTTTEKDKLAGIASGAEANQNAFSSISLPHAAVVPATGKTANVSFAEGSNITITGSDSNQDSVADTITISLQNSPQLSGTPTAPTATAGTNNTQIATTAFVTTAIANSQVGATTFKGTVSANSTISNSNYKAGWYWVVATAGTYVGETCEVGDMIFAIADKAASYSASNFSVVQSNLDLVAITNSEIDGIVV